MTVDLDLSIARPCRILKQVVVCAVPMTADSGQPVLLSLEALFAKYCSCAWKPSQSRIISVPSLQSISAPPQKAKGSSDLSPTLLTFFYGTFHHVPPGKPAGHSLCTLATALYQLSPVSLSLFLSFDFSPSVPRECGVMVQTCGFKQPCFAFKVKRTHMWMLWGLWVTTCRGEALSVAVRRESRDHHQFGKRGSVMFHSIHCLPETIKRARAATDKPHKCRHHRSELYFFNEKTK